MGPLPAEDRGGPVTHTRPLPTEFVVAMRNARDEPIVACDPDGRPTVVNVAAACRFGLRERLDAEDGPRLANADGRRVAWAQHPLKRALDGERLTAEPVWLLDDTGGLEPLEVVARALHGPACALLGAMMTLRAR